MHTGASRHTPARVRRTKFRTLPTPRLHRPSSKSASTMATKANPNVRIGHCIATGTEPIDHEAFVHALNLTCATIRVRYATIARYQVKLTAPLHFTRAPNCRGRRPPAQPPADTLLSLFLILCRTGCSLSARYPHPCPAHGCGPPAPTGSAENSVPLGSRPRAHSRRWTGCGRS